MKRILITTIAVIINITFLYAQTNTVERCGSDILHNLRLLNEPGYLTAYEKLQKYVEEFNANNPNGYSPKSVITIPVVFHIVLSPSENTSFPDTRCIENIATLNADYAGLNAHSMGAFSTSLKADCEIQFCLASISPTGSSTNGIERINYIGPDWMPGNNNLKLTSSGGLDAWNPSEYFNIWVCNLDYGLTGYGTYPTSLNNFYGMVIDYEYTGTTGSTAPYNLGGQATHEIGHCFNLPHIWGDAGNCTIDDGFGDTPTQFDATYGSPTGVLTDACTTTSPGIMYMNFMDYTDDNTYANFTPNQKTTMLALFAPGGVLEPLTTSNKCGVSVGADFVASPTILPAGSTSNFTNLTSGTYDSLQWSFQGGIPNQSVLNDPSGILYNNPGDFDVTLIVYSSLMGNDTMTKHLYIHVYDPSNPNNIQADFQATTQRLIVQGDNVTFQDLSSGNISSWHWQFEGGNPSNSYVQNPGNINYQIPGIWDVCLIVSDGLFTDTLCKQEYIVATTQLWPDPNGFCDTISNRAPTETPLTYIDLEPNTWGYMPGHNGSQTIAYADKYVNYTFNVIRQLIVPVAKAWASSPSAVIRFKIWSGSNFPEIEIGHKDIYINSMTPNLFYPVTFDNPVQVNGTFFCGYELTYSVPQDTFVCYMVSDRGSSGLNTLYVKASNNLWQTCNDIYGIHTSLGINVRGCLTNNLVNIEPNNFESKIIVYPSPSSGIINIDFTGVPTEGNEETSIIDLMGNELIIPKKQVSERLYQIDFSTLSTGIYFIIIRDNLQYYKTKVSIVH